MKPLFIICFLSVAIMATADQKSSEKLLHDGSSRFTANMFSQVAKANPEKSFVLSAFSVMTPLAQLSLASVDGTHDELMNAIGMPDDNSMKEVFSVVNTRLRSVKGVTLKTASKIYVAKNFELNKEFAAVTRDTFGSEVQNIDFEQRENAANEVNTWVEEQTNNRIKDLVKPDSLDSDTRALLVNAIYFKGLWEAQFDKTLTRKADFHVNNRDTTKVDMMYRRGDYKYTESSVLKSQVIEIPYIGGETSLVVVLPRDIEGIKEVQQILEDPKVLDKTMSEMYETEVDLYLPKFKIETTTDLKDILKKMDVKKIFSEHEARLENLLSVKSNLYVSSATQKAFMEVTEEGAEATAANELPRFLQDPIIRSSGSNDGILEEYNYGINIMELGLIAMSLGPMIYANKPFYFVLKMNSLPLFEGVMYPK